MKKFIFLTLIFLLTGCAKNNQDIVSDIQEYYINVESITNDYVIQTNLSDKSQEFVVNFNYNKDSSDYITVIEPENIAGLQLEILNNYTPTISFENIFLETFIEENLGVSPADMLSFAIFDLKEKQPSIININEVIKLSYIDEKISKDIYLNSENYDIISLEVYVDNNMLTKADKW